jgi:hypothetical protein
MGARHRVGIGLLYRPARLHRLAEFIPWNRFRGPIHVQKIPAQSKKRGGQEEFQSDRLDFVHNADVLDTLKALLLCFK